MKPLLLLLSTIVVVVCPIHAQEIDAENLCFKGTMLRIQGKTDEALSAYSFVLVKDPTHAKARRARSRLFSDLGRFDEARADVEVTAKTDKFASLLDEAYLNSVAKHFDDAIATYRKAITLDPSSPETYEGIASVNRMQRDFPAAIENYGRSIDLAPYESRQLHFFMRATVYMDARRYQEAIGDLNIAIRLEREFQQTISDRSGTYYPPNDETFFIERGKCYLEIKQFDLAISDFSYVIAKSGSSAKLFLWRSLAYKGHGDFLKSKEDLEKAKAMEPKIEEYEKWRQESKAPLRPNNQGD